jgi:hypothetical protein
MYNQQKDREAFEAFYTEDKVREVLWEGFNGDEIAEKVWLVACEYKDREHGAEIRKLYDRIESLVAENAKLFEDAKRELAYKDKKIAYLEAECERVYHPIREFWNQEKDEEMKRLKEEIDRLKNYTVAGYQEGIEELKSELNVANQILWEIVDAWYEGNAFGQKMYHIGTIITNKHYSYLKKFIGRRK